jgi:Heterokaryon incompatibility protein (HET)
MGSLLNAVKYLAKDARRAADIAVWLGHSTSRHYNAGARGVCLVCNNLQPYEHEDTFGRAGARWNDRDGQPEGWPALRAKTSAVVTLVLTDISPKKLLEAREIDKQTGLPKRNCRYCRLLCDIFDAFFIDEYMSWITETWNAMPISVGLMIREGLPLVINCWSFTYDKYILTPRVDLEVYSESAPSPTAHLAGAPSMGPVGHRSENVGSERCMRFMKECVRQCCAEHEACTAEAAGFVPTRLICLGQSNEDLRICESIPTNEGITWAALSHCWGGSQPYKLQRATLPMLKQHINSSDLPATFCNAIEVTRELGLHYLWIDSLCIVQDDKTDWQIEASRMATVYGRAFVVLSAASSPNPLTAFLGQRDEDWLPKRFEFETEQGVKMPIMVRQRHLLAAPLEQGSYEPPFTSAWASLKRVGPLYKRGWCFQETFLATRVLHFAPGAIIFECKTHRRSEDQLPPFPSTIPGTLGEVDDADQWRMIVKAYTQRQLSFASDKLPAIGGAASSMPQAQRSTYLAGLWRETLLLDLLWQVMPGGTHIALTYPRTEQNAPSWSWASMNRGVTWNPLKSPQLLAEVIGAETVIVDANPYGQVGGGVICLRGRIKPCHISTSRQKNEYWVYYIKDGSQSKKQHFRVDGKLISDTKPEESGAFARRARGEEWESEVQAAAVFLCIARTPRTDYNYVGLILSSSPYVAGCMERVGSITSVPSDWYESGETTSVIIV